MRTCGIVLVFCLRYLCLQCKGTFEIPQTCAHRETRTSWLSHYGYPAAGGPVQKTACWGSFGPHPVGFSFHPSQLHPACHLISHFLVVDLSPGWCGLDLILALDFQESLCVPCPRPPRKQLEGLVGRGFDRWSEGPPQIPSKQPRFLFCFSEKGLNPRYLYCVSNGFSPTKPTGLFSGASPNNECSEPVLSNYSKTGMLKRN